MVKRSLSTDAIKSVTDSFQYDFMRICVSKTALQYLWSSVQMHDLQFLRSHQQKATILNKVHSLNLMLMTVAKTIVYFVDHSRIYVDWHEIDSFCTLYQQHVLKYTYFLDTIVTFEITNQSEFARLKQTFNHRTLALIIECDKNIVVFHGEMCILNFQANVKSQTIDSNEIISFAQIDKQTVVMTQNIQFFFTVKYICNVQTLILECSDSHQLFEVELVINRVYIDSLSGTDLQHQFLVPDHFKSLKFRLVAYDKAGLSQHFSPQRVNSFT